MKEHYALSSTQLEYLNGQNMPKSFNEPKERARILKKAQQAWSIFIPILHSKTVDQKFKDRVLLEKSDGEITYNINNFFDYLVKTYGDESFEDIQNKIQFARMMIEHGFTFFQIRFKTNTIVSEKIKEIKTILKSLEELVRDEVQNKESLEIYRMRKKLPAPPNITRDDFWKAECIHCYSYSLDVSKTENEAIKNIKHDPKCRYLKDIKDKNSKERIEEINFQYIRTIPPLKKK